jgi:hypothetical protein
MDTNRWIGMFGLGLLAVIAVVLLGWWRAGLSGPETGSNSLAAAQPKPTEAPSPH